MKSFTLATACVLVAALVTMGAGCSKKGGNGANADSIAAAKAAAENILVRVAGRTVSQLDMERNVSMLLEQLRSFSDSAQIALMMPTVRKQALDNAINRILLENEVKKLGIKVDKAAVDGRIEMFRSNFVSEEAFNAELAKQHMNPDKLFEEIEVAMKAEELFARRTSAIPPATDAEIRTFYDANTERFQNPERVRASHILIKVGETDSDAVKAEKRAKIEGILASLKAGADFAEEARKSSECPSKQNGGDLGFFERGSMVPEFEKTAFALKPGQMSGIVETKFGYHIIRVAERSEPGTAPFEETRQQISTYLAQQKRNEAIGAFFDSLRTIAAIEYIDSTLVP